MPNILPFDKQVMAISALAEGSSIRAVERMTGIHRDTIMRLSVRIGLACEKVLDEMMRELECEEIEVDELWGFIGKKQRRVKEGEDDSELGDVWTFVALDPNTKIVPSFVIGKRDLKHTQLFANDLSARVKNRFQLSSDGMNSYSGAIQEAFGDEVDYGQIVKVFGNEKPERRYSPPPVVAIRKAVLSGDPDPTRICTSHVEKQNLTMRTHIRRLTRLTNAFSKKLENFRAAVALHFAYYNLVKVHGTIRCAPAMEAGLTSRLWTVRDLVGLPSEWTI